ncbi:STAS domain-containing protein [Hahella sp. NBU794]|uniref:STAS domain-containing protein n=1 Tax=Hahella sp. NBU794 TaxID=3422590 RepID=UPI003D6F3E1D
MSIDSQHDPEQNRLTLNGELTIYCAAEAKAPLLEHKDIDIDLSQLTELDGAGLQLLILAKRDRGARLVNASEAVDKVFTLTGLADMLE